MEGFYNVSPEEVKTYSEPTALVNFALSRVEMVMSPHPLDCSFIKPDLFASPHAESRAKEFFQEMTEAQARGCRLFGECVRYVEVLYPWESHDGLVSLLVKLKGFKATPSSSMSFKAVYSVPRVLCRSNLG